MTWAQPSMPVNEILRDEITKLDYTLIPPDFRGDVRTVRMMQDSISRYIDNLGELSARAQGLNKVITTAEKLVKAPTHTLYVMKDAEANKGAGEVIGLLKVGKKKLYLFDQRGQVLETEPLCVLDFFVLKARQRNGLGKRLFDHMIQDQGVLPKQMAIDGPSDKMATFLKKNYGVTDLVRQSNNFAVSAEFFIKDDSTRQSGHTTPQVPPGTGRYSAIKPHSSIAGVIHGGGSYVTETTNGQDRSGAPSPVEKVEAAPEPAEPSPPRSPPPDPTPAQVTSPPSRPSSLHIETQDPPASRGSVSPGAAGATHDRRDSQTTEQGYFDIKFYHNKLW